MAIEVKQPCHPLILIVVPNKDGMKHLSYSLESISKIDYRNFKVVIVDNCSKDNSVEYVRETYPEFEIIQKEADTGFAGSVNRGLLHGLEIGAEYLVVFSNDVKIHPQWLSSSICIARSYPECGVIGFVEVNDNNILLRVPTNIEAKYQSHPECAAIYILSSEVLKKVGLYDEGYYMYGEDNDFFYRCMKAGYQTLQTNIPVWHGGEGFSESVEKQQMVTKYVYRNWLRFAIKNYSFFGIIITLVKMFCYTFLPRSFWGNKLEHRSVNRLLRFNLGYRIKCLVYSIFWNIVNIQATKRAKLKELQWIERHTERISQS
jgi:GT2 family glycosyltransferase